MWDKNDEGLKEVKNVPDLFKMNEIGIILIKAIEISWPHPVGITNPKPKKNTNNKTLSEIHILKVKDMSLPQNYRMVFKGRIKDPTTILHQNFGFSLSAGTNQKTPAFLTYKCSIFRLGPAGNDPATLDSG